MKISGVDFKSNKMYIQALMSNRVKIFGEIAGNEIKRRAQPVTPLKDGDLSTLIAINSTARGSSITWTMPYAAYQERGMREDGSHVIKNYTTAGTGPHYARDSVHNTFRDFKELWSKTAQAVPAKNK